MKTEQQKLTARTHQFQWARITSFLPIVIELHLTMRVTLLKPQQSVEELSRSFHVFTTHEHLSNRHHLIGYSVWCVQLTTYSNKQLE
jgi:hypothetical protein